MLFEQVGLGHLVVEAAGLVVEVLVGEEVDVDAALGFIYLGHLGRNVEIRAETREGRNRRRHQLSFPS